MRQNPHGVDPLPARTAARRYATGPAITSEDALAAGLQALAGLDPGLVERCVAAAGPPPLRLRPAGFAGLAAIVAGQQLSTASAGAIFKRLEAQVAPLDAATLAGTPDALLRALGLSAGKARTLQGVAAAVLDGSLCFEALARMPAAQAHAALVALPGIGPWTADAFLLFCLGHPDAWPAGDLALQEAARVLLDLPARPGPAALEAIGERWRPWRGVAARLLWAYYAVLKGRGGMVLAAPEPEALP